MFKGPRAVSHLCAGGLQGCRGRSLGVGILLEQVRDRSEAGRLGHVGQDSCGLQSPLLQAQHHIIIITRFSCLEARCVCRQAAVKAAKVLPLVGLARSK
jgi:hypothetical protein